MNINEKDVKKLSIIILIAILLILVYSILKPVLMAALGGLILAYTLMPVYKLVNKYIKNKSLAASIVSSLVVLLIIGLLWVFVPILLRQISEVFIISQQFDIATFLRSTIPSSSDQFVFETTKIINNLITTGGEAARNSLLKIFLNAPSILIDLFIIAFVFFFALRDADKLKEFAKGISPLSEDKEKIVVKHFQDMTYSIVYGQVIVGIVQGLLAGIGLLIFGVDNVLLLTLLAIFFSIIPILGPYIVWIPIAIYLFGTGQTTIAIGYLLYNLLVVSIVDNLLRAYLVSKKTNLSQAVVIVGMMGGLFVFGILGLIIGPLLLAYLITLLESFKDKSIYTLFS